MEMPLVIFATRNPSEIALSLKKRNNIPVEKGMALWEYYIASALNASLDIPRIFVDYSEFLTRPMTSLEKTHSWLVHNGCRGLSMPVEHEVKSFIDADPYRAQAENNGIGFTHQNQQQLWQIITGNMPQVGDAECSEQSKKLLTSNQ